MPTNITDETISSHLVEKLNRDLRKGAATLGVEEARYFVDVYYSMQNYRIAAANQQRALTTTGEPSEFVAWFNGQLDTLENQIRTLLDKWSAAQPMGEWSRNVIGIGPVIAAGLLAHLDVKRAPTAGAVWRFAGLDPTAKWLKGQKRPWNASLKRLCWLIGESFVKVSGNKRDQYGKLYLERKAYETAKNEKGDYAEQAAAALARMKNKRERRAVDVPDGTEPPADPAEVKRYRALLEAGKLPPAALHERSKRWAVKLFLAHYHEVAYVNHYGHPPPLPYPIAHLGHTHLIKPQT